MNVMTFAHFMTRRTMVRLGSASIHCTYKALFRSAMIDAHRIAARYGSRVLSEGLVAARLAGNVELAKRMVELKQIDQRIVNEKMIVRKVVKNAISLGYTVSLYDGEEWTVRRAANAVEVMSAVQSTDEDTLAFYKDGKSVGSVYLVYGNSASEVIADYSDNLHTKAIIAPALARADKLSEVGL